MKMIIFLGFNIWLCWLSAKKHCKEKSQHLSLLPYSVTQTHHDNIRRQTGLHRIPSNKLESLPEQYFGGAWITDAAKYHLFWVASDWSCLQYHVWAIWSSHREKGLSVSLCSRVSGFFWNQSSRLQDSCWEELCNLKRSQDVCLALGGSSPKQ